MHNTSMYLHINFSRDVQVQPWKSENGSYETHTFGLCSFLHGMYYIRDGTSFLARKKTSSVKCFISFKLCTQCRIIWDIYEKSLTMPHRKHFKGYPTRRGRAKAHLQRRNFEYWLWLACYWPRLRWLCSGRGSWRRQLGVVYPGLVQNTLQRRLIWLERQACMEHDMKTKSLAAVACYTMHTHFQITVPYAGMLHSLTVLYLVDSVAARAHQNSLAQDQADHHVAAPGCHHHPHRYKTNLVVNISVFSS